MHVPPGFFHALRRCTMHAKPIDATFWNPCMPAALTLQCQQLRCELVPALGGCISGLWLAQLPVLRSTPATELTTVRESGSYPLVPYSNRIGKGDLQWMGAHYALTPNFSPEPHSIHGVGWCRPWQVLLSDAQSARLGYVHRADADWPFDFESTQEVRLTEDSLELRIAMKNLSAQPVPAGLGWHPYFAKRAGTRVRFAASGRWEMGEDKLPTQLAAHTGLDANCSELTVDHCFAGWSGTLELLDPQLRVQVESNLRYLVVFTTPQRDNIAIEPVSHVNNALALAGLTGRSVQDLGIRTLQAGESMDCTMRIRVQQQP